MIAIIEDRRPEIEALCRQFGIRELELFGSAATGAFDPATSDLDFIVDLGEYDLSVVDRLLDFADALEALLGHRVDLTTVKSVKSPWFKAEVERSKRTLYDAGARETAA